MSTTGNKVLLAGESPLYADLQGVLTEKGYEVVSLDRWESASERVAWVIEVTAVDLERKRSLIETLDRLLPPDVPILTSTLSVTATEVASWTHSPQRICGFGTFVPLAERELIEIAPALQTNGQTTEQAEAFIRSLGKEVEVVDDEVGLVFPRILALIVNEAVFTVMEGTAMPEDIDVAMKMGTNYPYGPLEWADRIGLDEIYAVMRGLHRDLGEERYRPAPLLRKMVLAGRLGVRSGQGFYTYS
jgi:3-hydroxybutyryl-CoA dehydrogenase